MTLQQQGNAIILMLDANQTPAECCKGNQLKSYFIEWLRLQRGLQDPFLQHVNAHPNSTTITPNRDINYILTFGVHCLNISTL